MGMDVNGIKPTSEVGVYFRNNVWWWRPLWQYCERIAPDLIPEDNLGHTNDGWGLDGADSLLLAQRLETEIITGNCAAYEEAYKKHIESMEMNPCDLCHGTGIRDDDIGKQRGFDTRVIDEPEHPRHGQTGWCNSCDGVGKVKPWMAHYPFSVDNVKNFAAFLKDCGGFEIF